VSNPELPFTVSYHPEVKKTDIALFDDKTKQRIRKGIEERLLVEPHRYGRPLRRTLKGYWKLRVGDYRVVFKVIRKEIRVLGICHRKDIYKKVPMRSNEK